MLDPKIFDDLAKKLNDAIPPGVKEVKKDLEQTFRTILQSAFSKLDLVTREEFDAQVRVLARTRAKLEAIEQKLTDLESSKSASPKHQPHKKTD